MFTSFVSLRVYCCVANWLPPPPPPPAIPPSSGSVEVERTGRPGTSGENTKGNQRVHGTPPRAQRRHERGDDNRTVARRGRDQGYGESCRYYADEERFWRERSSDNCRIKDATGCEGIPAVGYVTGTAVKSVNIDDARSPYAQARADRVSGLPDADDDHSHAGGYHPRVEKRTPFQGSGDRGNKPVRRHDGVPQVAALPYQDQPRYVLDCHNAEFTDVGSDGRPAHEAGISGVAPEASARAIGLPTDSGSSDRQRQAGVASSRHQGRNEELGGDGAAAACATETAGAARALRAEEIVEYGIAPARGTRRASTPVQEDRNQEAEDVDDARRHMLDRAPLRQPAAAAAAVAGAWGDTARGNNRLAAQPRLSIERDGLQRRCHHRRREAGQRRFRSLRDAEKILDGVLESVEAGLSSDVCSGVNRNEVGARWTYEQSGKHALLPRAGLRHSILFFCVVPPWISRARAYHHVEFRCELIWAACGHRTC